MFNLILYGGIAKNNHFILPKDSVCGKRID